MRQIAPEQIPCPIKAQLALRPEAIAIYRHAPDASLSYGELDQAISGLDLAQMPAGEAMAVILEQPLDLIVWLLACLRHRVIFCPINPLFSDQEIQQRCHNAGIKYYISDNGRHIAGLTKFVAAHRHSHASAHPNAHQSAHTSAHLALSQPATLVFTSGSSGQPKAAQHSLSNHYYSALGSQQLIPFKQADCWLLSLPLYHIGGIALVFRALFAGGSIALGSKNLCQDLAQFPVSHASLVPTQVYRLLQQECGASTLQLRYLLVGGAALSDSLIKLLATQPFASFASYGLTEMSSQVATVKLGPDTLQPLQYEILPYRQVSIRDKAIMLSGPCLFMGYREQGQLRPSPAPLNSKDSGSLQAQTLQVTGRLDNMFIAGGENVQPEQVEQTLANFDMVKQAIVVPIADPEFGQIAVAYIDWQTQANPQGLSQMCRQHLAPWQRPKHILPWPKWQGLKPNRKALQQQAEQILTKS
ncbi:AMP-binding protein [Motilimonas sp. KMU-193]|uniref:AMP-binding protein n=1 Tax=Motilimonas sp. KMU-193 TaxID=3388668 RepID=UPI00396AF348